MNRRSMLRLPQGLNSLLKKSEEQIAFASMRTTFSPIFCMEGENVSRNVTRIVPRAVSTLSDPVPFSCPLVNK
jgi:hypothetical protein